jgi:hypothetical protein
MKRSRFSGEQVTYALRQAEGASPVADLCRQLGVSEATFHYGQRSTPIWVSARCIGCASPRTKTTG